MARPRKKTEEKLNCQLPAARVSEAEADDIRSKAEQAGMSVSQFLRTAALRSKIVVRQGSGDHFPLLEELRYSGHNLNQLTKRFHITGIEPAELRNALYAHEQVLRKILDAL